MAQDPPALQITTFRSDKDPQGERHTVTWSGLIEWLSKPIAANVPKSALPMWSPAVFVGDRRAAKNVERVCAMVFDVDEAPVPSLEEIGRALAGLTWCVHTSSSSRPLDLKWRLIVALARPVTGEEHAHMWRVLTEKLPFRVGQASKDPSRAWYFSREGAE